MPSVKKFGTFSGVFTPSILTILGVIMYLRLPSIVGQAGLWSTIGIIVVAHIISVATGLSVASIATDKKVQAGGTYYMLSRSLGLPIGGTLGLALFVGLSFSVSLYVIGFSESFLGYWGWQVSKNSIRVAGTVTLIAVTVVTLISTALALKAQFFIMAAIVLSLLSIFFGNHDLAPTEPLLESLPSAAPFIVLFGIFFPAVTGFEAGVSMSGDLSDPKKSIPQGTIWAIGVGLVVYIGLAFFFSYTVRADVLVDNPNVLLDISLFAPAVVAGIWGATISSALGSILGAPRILQATASDRVVHRYFAVGFGKENEPRRALILTFLIAEAGILIGELDVIARIVSMFFITTYGFLNLSCYIESWASPDFRPDFKIPSVVSLLGAVACFVVMIQLDFVAMIGASVLLGLVFLYLKRKELTLETGDTWEGFWSSVLRAGLQRLARSDVHERNWRPNILLFSFGTKDREPMMEFGGWLVRKRGLLSNFDLTVNPQRERLQARSRQAVEAEKEIAAGIFSRRLECPDAFDAMESIAAFYGYSGVDPNTVVMGWGGNSRHPERFLQLIRRYAELDLNLLLLNIDRARGYGARRTIDVWWRGGNNNISLTLSLIRFLTSSDSWTGATIRFLVINEGDTAFSDAIRSRMDGILETYRIEAGARVISNVVGRKPIHEIIGYESVKTDLTIIGMPVITAQNASSYMEDTGRLLERLGTVLLVKASSFFNNLSVGIETSARHSQAEEAESRAVAELPALTLPDDETLRWALQHFDEEIEAISRELVEQPFVAMYDIHGDMGEECGQAIRHAFGIVERMLEQSDRPRMRRAIQRAQSGLAFQARHILESFAEGQLPMQERLLESALARASSQVRQLVRQTPEELTRTIVSTNGRETRSGGGRFSLNLWRTGPGAITVRFRDLVDVQTSEGYFRLLLATVRNMSGTIHAFSEGLLVQLQNAFDALQRLAHLVEEGSLDATVFEEVHGRVRQGMETLLSGYSERRLATGRNILVETRNLAQQVVSEVTTGTGRPTPNRAEQERLGTVLPDIPLRWGENHRLLLSRATLGILLISFQQRLSTIVQRYREETILGIQNTVARPLRDMESEVDGLLTSGSKGEKKWLRVGHPAALDLDLGSSYNVFVTDIRNAVEEIPESIRTLPEQAVQHAIDRPLDEVEVISVSLRRVVDYIVEMELLGPLQEEISEWPIRAQRLYGAAEDVLRLVSFEFEESESGPADTRHAVLEKGVERLRIQIASLSQETEMFERFIGSRLDAVLQQLNPYTITRTEGDLQRYVRGHKSRQIQSRVRILGDRVANALRDGLVRILYRRSEGILFARQLQEADPYRGAVNSEGLRLIEQVSPKDDVLRALPLHYRQLFLDLPNITQEFWVGGDAHVQSAHQAVDRWKRGTQGGLLVLGEARSGKTALCQLIAQTHFKRDEVFYLNPLEGGSIDPAVFERELKRALGAADLLEDRFAQLPARTVLIIDDLERWWERSAAGTAVLAQLVEAMERYGRRCLFLVNANVHAFKLIDRIYPLSDRFLDIVTRTPSNAEQIKEVISLRHRSAGLRFILEDQLEDDVSAWRLARLFTSLFDYARGNVGVALQGWIAGIDRVAPHGLFVEPKAVPDFSVLDSLSTIQKALLAHVILHGSMTLSRLLRISELEESQLRHEIQALQRMGWLRESELGAISVDRFLLPHLTRAFVEKTLI